MSEELSREQVERSLDKIAEVYEWKHVVNYLRDHDATLRAKLEELTQRAEKAERILSAAGIPQSIQDVRNAWSALTERDEQIASLTAQLAEKEKDQHYVNISYLQQQLAAMTQERDKWKLDHELLCDDYGQSKQQLAASEQRVRELEGTLENYQKKYHDAMAILSQWGDIDKADAIAQLAETQATVTAQAEEMGRLRGHLTIRRQELEACIAAEVIAGNFWKEKIERAALVEIALMEKALASGKEAVLSGKLESERDQLQATVTRLEKSESELIEERDRREEQIEKIYEALNGDREWSSECDLGEEALALAEEGWSPNQEITDLSAQIADYAATVTAQGEEIARLTACITAQGAQMLAYHDTLKQVLASGKEAI